MGWRGRVGREQVGISFHQSASVEHFRRVRRAMQTVGRMDTLQVVRASTRKHEGIASVTRLLGELA
jgi:hypothetical protein